MVAGWIGALAVLAGLAVTNAGSTTDAYTVPDAPSQQAQKLLDDHGLSDDTSNTVRVAVHNERGIDLVRAPFEHMLSRAKDVFPEATIISPYSDSARDSVSADGTVAYAEIRFDTPPDSETADALENMAPDNLDVAFSGPIFETADSGGPGEGIGLLAAVVVLLVAFGSVLAMGLPILVALFGAGCGVAAIMLAANIFALPSAAVPLAAMLAVGVGIDYSLLVVTRYREGFAAGLGTEHAITDAQTTAGRSVLFAGVTVVISVLGLLVVNMPLVNGVAIGAAVSVAVTMLASLTLLPALLGFVGTKIDRLSLPRRRSRNSHSWAKRWSKSVQQHPWSCAVISVLILITLAIPAAELRLGFATAGSLSPDNTARQAHDMMANGFGPGVNAPLFIAVDARDATSQQRDSATDQIAHRVGEHSDVAQVSPAVHSDDGQVGMLIVTPDEGPHSQSTNNLVHDLRSDVLPETAGDTAISANVTGQTAAAVDFADYTSTRLPLFIGVVLALAFVLLLFVFNSVLVPLKAVVMNLLSIGAAFGIVVAAVQWGWGTAVFQIDTALPVIAWVPMMLVAVIFGLSMDYEVFLLSRIKENYDVGQPNGDAVASGLASTARVISAAAAIMICVFGSFVLGSAIDLAVFGFGLAVAVLIDATLIRMVLVPATMEILGDANWWLPQSIQQLLSRRLGMRT